MNVPEYLKDYVSDNAEMLASVEAVPRISLRGKKFRFKVDGEIVNTVNDSISGVIVGVYPTSGFSRTYYENPYTQGSDDPPDCSSFNGIEPDSWVDRPLSDLCVTCDKSKWGSAISPMSGKKAKACKESKRLFFILEEDIPKLAENESVNVWLLTVTVSGLKNLTSYAKSLDGIPYYAVITEIIMDDESDFPKLMFSFKDFLEESEGVKTIEFHKSEEWVPSIYRGQAPALEAGTKQARLEEPSEPPFDESTESANLEDLADQF